MHHLWTLIASCFIFLWIHYIRPLVKAFLRRTTGLCELQRICYATHGASADRCLQLEKSLTLSRSKVIKKVHDKIIWSNQTNQISHPTSGSISSSTPLPDSLLTSVQEAEMIEFAIEAIFVDKKIKRNIHEEFVFSLRISLTQMFYYKKVTEEAIDLAKIPYNEENEEHRGLLIKLWNLVTNDNITSLSDGNWSDIGFQGKDPATDFRGMGLLGLKQLVFLAEEFTPTVQSIVSSCNHPVKGYPFAITGINLTHLTLSLLKEGALKTHFYNFPSSHYWIEDVHKVYSYISIAFNKFWLLENPRDVMEFRVIREKFVTQLVAYLRESEGSLVNWACQPVVEA